MMTCFFEVQEILLTHLYHFHIWQTVQEGLQINAIKNNAVVKYVSIGLEINHCLFLQVKKRKQILKKPLIIFDNAFFPLFLLFQLTETNSRNVRMDRP